MKNKKFRFLAVPVLALSLFLAGCADDEADAPVVDEPGYTEDAGDDEETADVAAVGGRTSQDTITVGVAGNIANRDPHGSNDNPSSQAHRHVFETLIYQDANLDLHPLLAESWEQLDDYNWKFNLVQDAYFHNGNLMTAYDVAFTMKRAADSPFVSAIVGMIDPDSIEIVDEFTIIIGTEMPFAPFLAHLAHPAASILNAEAIRAGAGEDGYGARQLDFERYNESLVGTGPFIITEHVMDSHLVFERWDGFRGELPNMREIRQTVITDAQARLAALETGAVDKILGPAPTDIARLEADPNVNLLSVQGLGLEYMGLNFNHPYLGIQEVRQAINYALQTAVIVDVTLEGTANTLTSFVPSNVFGYHPTLEGFDIYESNIERAQELLDSVGVEGFSMSIMVNGESATRGPAAEIIQAQLSPLGIQVDIQVVDWNAYLAALDANDFDAFIGGWLVVSGDADYGLFPLFHSSEFPSSNRVGIQSAELDALLDAARGTTVEADRLAYYHAAQEYLREAAPVVLLQNANIFVPTQLGLRNFTMYPHQGFFWGNVYFVYVD